MADTDAVKAALEKNREASERSRAQARELASSKPTPTQEECDRAALGEHVTEHEDDGSGPEPIVTTTRSLEAKKPAGGYTTRASTPTR